jgi:hypothetical protein
VFHNHRGTGELAAKRGALTEGVDNVVGVGNEDPRTCQHMILDLYGERRVALEVVQKNAVIADSDLGLVPGEIGAEIVQGPVPEQRNVVPDLDAGGIVGAATRTKQGASPEAMETPAPKETSPEDQRLTPQKYAKRACHRAPEGEGYGSARLAPGFRSWARLAQIVDAGKSPRQIRWRGEPGPEHPSWNGLK